MEAQVIELLPPRGQNRPGVPGRSNCEATCFTIALGARSAEKNRLVAEYALLGLDQSIAVAAWQTHLTEFHHE